MKQGLDFARDQVKEFHETFGHPVSDKPQAMSLEMAKSRVKYKVEELVEFLYATANNDKDLFYRLITDMANNVYEAEANIVTKGEPVEDVLVGQADALVDELYFTMGDFVTMGLYPQPLFNHVQDANMNKRWPDGTVKYDENNGGKIMKPPGWVGPEILLKTEINRQRGE